MTPPQWPSWGRTLRMGLPGYPHHPVSPSFPLNALFQLWGFHMESRGRREDPGLLQCSSLTLQFLHFPSEHLISYWAEHSPDKCTPALWVTSVRSLLGQT